MTHVLSKELRGRDITVNAVAPGPTATELFLKGKPQEVVDQLSKLAPLERLGHPEDIANTVGLPREIPMADGSTVRCFVPTEESSDTLTERRLLLSPAHN